jgi:hypothetical protein
LGLEGTPGDRRQPRRRAFLQDAAMKHSRPFEITIVALTLMLLGVLKLVTWQHIGAEEIDSLLGVKSRGESVIAGVFEIGFGLILLRIRPPRVAIYLSLAAGCVFITARWLYLSVGGTVANCACLGGLPGLWPLLKYYSANILMTLSLWITMLSVAALRWHQPIES